MQSPNGRRSSPSTTRTPCTRRTGTAASERCSSPRRIRSRSPSRVTVKPAKVTSAPATDSAQARSRSPTAASSQPNALSGASRVAVSTSLGSPNVCVSSCEPAASTGRMTPSCPAVSAASSSSRRLSRRSGSATSGVSATSTSGRRARTASRSRSTAAGPSASSTISPLAPPPAVCTLSATTPNSRCTGPATVSRPWMRLSGTVVDFLLTMPLCQCTPRSSTA